MIIYEVICDRCGARFQDPDGKVWFETQLYELCSSAPKAELHACDAAHTAGWVRLEIAPFGVRGVSLFCKTCWIDFMTFYKKAEVNSGKPTVGYEKGGAL